MKSILQFSRLIFVVLSFAILLLAGCGGSDSTPTATAPFTVNQVSGKTFAYSSSTGTTGTLLVNADGTWSTTIGASTFSGTWSITDGKLVCVTTSGGNHTLTYTALVSDDTKAIHTSVVEVNPADPANPATYTATLTALYTIVGKVSESDTGMAGVTVDLEGDQTLTATTDADGNYSFMVPAGEYRVTPSKVNTTFAPLDNSFAVGSADVRAVDFASVAPMAGPIVNKWIQTGSLIYGRAAHTATLLQNGKVLVAGGEGDAGTRASAELYDPATGTWTQTGYMNYDRSSHTATLLPNGKVLVAGGGDDGFLGFVTTRASAELYDPATGKWTQTGSMTDDRQCHTATLLQNGKVLVVGGEDNIYTHPTAELYDPATGKWTKTGSMNYKRFDHTATLLQDGRVLVAGGTNSGDTRASAELYDPATGKWTQTGSLTESRRRFAATILQDGKVLVAGGDHANPGSGILTSAEIYDPATGTWTKTAMKYEHTDDTATLLQDGRVIVAGQSMLHDPPGNVEIYDPVTGLWTETGSLNYRRDSHTATLLDYGAVLVVGGFDGATIRASAELFFPGP